MKKSYFFSALAAGMVMFSACSSDNDLANGGNGSNDAVQQIVLQVANAGDGMQTRAGRPLLSSEAKQTIENVKVIICDKSNKIVKVKTYDDWNNADSKVYGKGGGAHGRETTLTYTGTEKLGDGTYTIYAYGFHKGTAYKKLDTQIANLAEGQTLDQNIVLECSAVGEEIFAGSTAQFTIDNAHKGFTQTVVLNRQVAGTFGYFDKIPYVAGATKLQLVASNGNTGLVLGGFNSFDLTGNGTGNDGHVNYVVNGTTAATDNVVYTINLKDWFTEVKDDDNNGLIDDTKWKTPASYAKAKFATGSVFGGTFLIPFAKKTSENTFVLQLTNAAGVVLKSWAVKLPSTDGQLSEYTLSYWNTSATTPVFAKTPGTKDEADKYSVVRNHLYGIGKRSLDEPTTPGTDPDKPEPLNKKQELTLRVNDNWEVIHKMELE